MDETPEQKFNRISRAVQESILRNYPNPERRGCPGDNVVRDVAARTESRADDLWEHITHCSPCYAIFLAAKQEFRNKRTIRRRTAIGLLAAAAAAVPIFVVSHAHTPGGNQEIGNWNLETTASSRGPATSDQNRVTPQRALRSRGYIRVHLPLGSEEGQYQLQIRRSEDGPALQTAMGEGRIINGHTLVTFAVDLSSLSAGSYFAAIGRGNRIWRVYPLLLSN